MWLSRTRTANGIAKLDRMERLREQEPEHSPEVLIANLKRLLRERDELIESLCSLERAVAPAGADFNGRGSDG